MRIQSRLGKLERSGGARGVEDMCRPADVPEQIWRRAMELLTALPPREFGPWESVEGVAQWSSAVEPQGPADFPQPLLDCLIRAEHEAQTGALPPPWNERGHLLRASLANWSDDRLIDFLRELDEASPIDHRLPHPYSESLLERVGPPRARSWAAYYACQLRRGAMSPAEHAAELAKFLPPFTRADLEETVRNLPLEILGYLVESS